MAEVDIDIPCVKLPELPEIPSIKLVGGAELRAFLDMSKGMPNNCSVTMSLMAQISPLLASLSPLIQIVGVIEAIGNFAKNPLVNAPDLVAKISELAQLFASFTPAQIAVTIAGVLKLLVSFLECVITMLSSSISFQAEIAGIRGEYDLDLNPPSLVLQASLDCAEANAELALEQASAMMGPVEPLLAIVGTLSSLAGISLDLPSTDLSASADASAAIEALEDAVGGLKAALDSLPV